MKRKKAKSFSTWVEKESRNGVSIKKARKITAEYEKPLSQILNTYKV